MSIDSNKVPILYSVGTFLAYNIAKEFYKEQYVWCTTDFNSQLQPPTSRPLTICRRLLEQIVTSDRHTTEIYNNKSGILKGAKSKLDEGKINRKQYQTIRAIVSYAKYEEFYPVIYIIYSDIIKSRCIEVDKSDRASDNSIEYKIIDLKDEEFSIISFKDILYGIIIPDDVKAGE